MHAKQQIKKFVTIIILSINTNTTINQSHTFMYKETKLSINTTHN